MFYKYNVIEDNVETSRVLTLQPVLLMLAAALTPALALATPRLCLFLYSTVQLTVQSIITVQYSTELYSTVQYKYLQYSTVPGDPGGVAPVRVPPLVQLLLLCLPLG